MTGVVHVRWAEPSSAECADGWLDRTERRRLRRLRHEADRSRFLVSRALLKQLVAELSGVDPVTVRLSYHCLQCGEPHGKPCVAGSFGVKGWQLSISHAGGRVLVAATGVGAVGVDVEAVEKVRFDGFDSVALSPRETAAIAALPAPARDAARATAWVRKEAVLKALGPGLALAPASVDLANLRPGAEVLDLSVGDGYAAAVAVLTDAPVRLDVARVSEPLRSRPAARGAPARTASSAAAR
jgi:4'-phosphopantetheinyl transferase